jgi:hypothetical protein
MINDKTPYLNLPLPNQGNLLSEDLPRLRESFLALDAKAQSMDQQTAQNDAARPVVASQAEVDAGTNAAKFVTPKTLKSTTFPAWQISGGTLDISLMPAAALEDLITVANDAALYTLTAEDVHLGMSVRVLADSEDVPYDPPKLFIVHDLTQLDRPEGYRQYAVVTFWEDVQNKPALALSADLAGHDAGTDVHAALVKRITAGDVSPVIGVCWIDTGNCTGLWYNCDEDGQPVTPPKRYFDFHPLYAGMRRVLIDGQVMVEVPPFWIKTLYPDSGPFAGKLCKIISPAPREGFRPHPAFLSLTGEVVPAYIGAYQATSEASSMAGSRPGKLPLVSLDFPTMQARCTNRNTGGVEGFRMWDYFHYSALCLLYLIEHCTTESQLILGRGHVDGSAATYTDDPKQPQWRGLVGLYGNVWQMVDGIKLDTSRGIQLFKPDGSRVYEATGKTAPAHDGTNIAYVIACQTGEANGFNFDDYFLPLTASTSYTSASFPDYFWGGYGSAGNVLYVGGSWSSGVGAGLFCANLSSPASDSDTSIGCRLAK